MLYMTKKHVTHNSDACHKKKKEKRYINFQVVKHFNTLKHYSNINMVVASPPSALML